MRYIKALVLVLMFFVAMIFLFQNQASLSQTLSFRLDLLFMPAMTSIELPFYFVLLAAFLLGAVLCLLALLWDRMRLSTRIVRANFRVQAMQNEERKLVNQMEKLAEQPRESRLKLFFGGKQDKKKEEKAAEPAQVETVEKAEEPRKDAQPEMKKDTADVSESLAEKTPDEMDAAQATDSTAQNKA